MTAPEIIDKIPTTSEPGLKADLVEELVARRAPGSSQVISRLLTEQDGDVRRVAADALAEIGDPGILPALTAALSRETSSRVRIALAEAIDELRER